MRRAVSNLDPAVVRRVARESTLSKQKTFNTQPDNQGRFSPQLVRPSQLFESTEQVVASVGDLAKAVELLKRKNPGLPLVWRGQQNADWGLQSSLYRHLLKELGTKLPEGAPVSSPQRFPTEAEMAAVEGSLFEIMKEAWRVDDVPGLELLARLQHHGGPTRLLDVTRNPLMALWFAAEPSDEWTENDARLFAVATQPALPQSAAPFPRYMDAPLLTQGSVPFWLEYESDEQRRSADWGTGTQRRVWIPPAYDDRITAQNAAFLLEGLPLPSEDLLRAISTASDAQVPWNWADLAAAASFYVIPERSTRKSRPHRHRLAPVFTFRIPSAAKRTIWAELTETWGLLRGVVYPDVEGMVNHLRNDGGWVTRALATSRDESR